MMGKHKDHILKNETLVAEILEVLRKEKREKLKAEEHQAKLDRMKLEGGAGGDEDDKKEE
jgi:hypothetical protein